MKLCFVSCSSQLLLPPSDPLFSFISLEFRGRHRTEKKDMADSSFAVVTSTFYNVGQYNFSIDNWCWLSQTWSSELTFGSRNQNLYEITINQELVSKRECFWPKSEVDLFAFLANFLHFCINFQHLCKLLVSYYTFQYQEKCTQVSKGIAIS